MPEKTYAIILETNCFGDINKYNFEEGQMAICTRSFKTYSNINVFMPSITYEELKNHIKESIRLSIQGIKSIYLKNDISEEQIEGIYQKQIKNIDDFIKRNGITIIDCERYADLKEVDKWYFDCSPPFEEHKKSEFPDAIIISAVKNYFVNNKCDEVIAISDDEGYRKGIVEHAHFRAEENIVNIMRELLDISDKEIRNCFGYIKNKEILSLVDTYKIESIDINDEYDVTDIEYSVNDYEIVSKDDDSYLMYINCDLVLKGEFNIIDQDMTVYDYEDPQCSAIFNATGDEIIIKDFDVYITLYKDKNGKITEHDFIDIETINLSEFVHQLNYLD